MNNINKKYSKNNNEINALSNINVNFEKGKFYAIMGHSGSGKSTLLSIIGLINDFDSGKYFLENKDIKKLNDIELSKFRMNKIGFIFQDFYLDEHMTALENVMLPMIINDKIQKNERKNIALDLLKKVNMLERASHLPKELSGGEQQRIAIARALANNPAIILADEPTGNLDVENEKIIFEELKKLSKSGKCVIVVSHSNEAIKYADIVMSIEKGELTLK